MPQDVVKTVNVPGNSKVTISAQLTMGTAGAYTVGIVESPALGSKTVTVNPSAANITLSNFTVTPASLTVGGTITMSVDATNSGGSQGSVTVTFHITP